MITRSEYFADQSWNMHNTYYREIAEACGIGRDFFPPGFLERVRNCLLDGDKSLLEIDMEEWKTMFANWEPPTSVMTDRGDSWTEVGKLCTLKSAARAAIQLRGAPE